MKRNDLPIRLQYRTFPGSGNILWPVIEITLSTKQFSLKHPIVALIDSGASSSTLHPIIAEVLGFDSQKVKSDEGISVSGSYESWTMENPVSIEFYDYSFQRTFTVINNPSLLWPCILGGDSIFEIAGLHFYKFKGYFELEFREDLH